MTICRFLTLSMLWILLMAPAASASSELHADEIKPLLEPARDPAKPSPALRSILKATPGTAVFEIRKMEYLLERLTRSTCVFIRNGQEYKGPAAAMHMRWKYTRYKDEVKTADDFIRKIADGSRKTHEDYKIKTADGQTYSSVEILLNELAVLDEILRKEIS